MAGYADGIVSVAKAGGEMLFGGWRDTMKALSHNHNLKDSAFYGFGAHKGDALSVELGGRQWSGTKIAGGVAGLGIGYRFLSGGGAYRDKNGNTDIAGLPFV